ncbi:MAG: TrmH family RNA methyltransferase, partial [Patescibacteria group bacterium]
MNKKEIFVICHNIRSRHNIGSIFRTADGAGVSKIFLCGITPSPPHPNIEKVSLGAENFVEWEKSKETWRVIEKLKKENFEIVALEQ